jgi:hypothetical protein
MESIRAFFPYRFAEPLERGTHSASSSLFIAVPPLNGQSFYLPLRSGALPCTVTKFGQDLFNVIHRNTDRGFDHLSQKIAST